MVEQELFEPISRDLQRYFSGLMERAGSDSRIADNLCEVDLAINLGVALMSGILVKSFEVENLTRWEDRRLLIDSTVSSLLENLKEHYKEQQKGGLRIVK